MKLNKINLPIHSTIQHFRDLEIFASFYGRVRKVLASRKKNPSKLAQVWWYEKD
jgi:hypothetical protein